MGVPVVGVVVVAGAGQKVEGHTKIKLSAALGRASPCSVKAKKAKLRTTFTIVLSDVYIC